jgi:hypothetical protein
VEYSLNAQKVESLRKSQVGSRLGALERRELARTVAAYFNCSYATRQEISFGVANFVAVARMQVEAPDLETY